MAPRRALRALFWLLLLGFIAWDFMHSQAIDVRNEPPMIAAGSGQAASGGHCSMAK
jgi:hypothetical protein